MTPERLTELRSKVRHGFNLQPSEAREVFAHYGEPIEEARKRCGCCGGDGVITLLGKRVRAGDVAYNCGACNGTGYEVVK